MLKYVALEYMGNYCILDVVNFGTEEDHFKNLSQFKISNDFSGTRLKFKRLVLDIRTLEKIKKSKEEKEEFERCAELRDNILFLKKL
ncbi:MAG TPA: hypothetical protein VJI69_08080 [Bacteroidia bacterium]|nr:hypothetical protein [Bacteroidia bacterium]